MKRFFTPEQKKVIFFDMNQTLLDPQQSFNEGFLDTLQEYMGRWQPDQESIPDKILQTYLEEWKKRKQGKAKVSQTKDEIRLACLAIALRPLPFPVKEVFLKSFLQRIKAFQEENPRLFADVDETLKQLADKSYRLAILSNGSKTKQELQLKQLNIDNLFPYHFTSQKGDMHKPHPAFFRHALQTTGISPAQGVMVGNSWRSDVQGAVRSGMDVVWLQPSHNKQSSQRKIGNQRVIIIKRFEQLKLIF